MDKIINGKEVASYIKEELKKEISNISDKLKLVVIQVGNDEASNVYVNNKRKLSEETGIEFEHLKYDENVKEEVLLAKIDELNNDKNVTGILVQLPLPRHLNAKTITERINYKKDVDGLTTSNIGKLYNKEKAIIPCTAYGIIKLLEYYDIKLEGLTAVIIGRSNLVGIPLFKLLLDKNCTVTMCHSKTKNLVNYTKNADIIVVATGKKGLLTKDMINDNTILIDVGINRVDNKLYGDIDASCYEKEVKYTPVPGGVGPMTVIMLINNVLECYKLQK